MPRRADRPPRLFLEQTFVTARRVRPAGAVAYALCDLAATARDGDDMAASRVLLRESLSLFRALDDDLGVAQGLAQLGNLVCVEGCADRVRRDGALRNGRAIRELPR
jgi:hypothetical protein